MALYVTPRENPDLFGHEAAEAAIQAALTGARMHHAWLISGPEGVGKATLAFRFARRLLAGPADSLRLAPDHPVFRRVAAGTHADLLTVEREWDEKKKRIKKHIAAETVREVPGFLHLTPAEGGWRAVIVDGAEDMNIQSANALLKVLEEPPPRAVLLLVSSAPGRLLPTIRSRCRPLKLRGLNAAAMDGALSRLLPGLGPDDRQPIAALANGAPGRALMLAESDGLAVARLVDEVVAQAPIDLTRGYAIADAVKEEAAFDLFFGLLRQRLAEAARDGIAGRARDAVRPLLALRPPQAWAELWSRLGALHDETDRANLDRRQAVVLGLALFR